MDYLNDQAQTLHGHERAHLTSITIALADEFCRNDNPGPSCVQLMTTHLPTMRRAPGLGETGVQTVLSTLKSHGVVPGPITAAATFRELGGYFMYQSLQIPDKSTFYQRIGHALLWVDEAKGLSHLKGPAIHTLGEMMEAKPAYAKGCLRHVLGAQSYDVMLDALKPLGFEQGRSR